jgi:hypothetical protein
MTLMSLFLRSALPRTLRTFAPLPVILENQRPYMEGPCIISTGPSANDLDFLFDDITAIVS